MKTNKLTGTKEWADENYNKVNGCEHDCKYCYAKADMIRFKRHTSDSWKKEKLNPQKQIQKICSGKRVMFPSSHDITPKHLVPCMNLLKKLLQKGNHVLIVSKPHLECIKAICKRFVSYKDKILFRFTIGSTDSNILKFWEPNAPDFKERLNSLKYAYKSGYQTSVSCEPALDTNTFELVKQVSPYVTETIWIGIMKMAKARLTLNGWKDTASRNALKDLVNSQDFTYLSNLYQALKNNPQIRWKDTIRKILGI